MKKKSLVLVVLLLALSVVLTACSARSQARWEGTVNLGDLPEDMLYVNGVPQIVTISTESDGDIVMVYYSSDGQHVYAQLYGCAVINLTCDRLFEQGRYEWNIPQQ